MSFGAEVQFDQWRGRRFYVSVDTRNKLQYAYHATPAEPETRQWSTNLQIGRTLEEDLPVLPFDEAAAVDYAALAAMREARGLKVPVADAMIAATCLSHRATLATRNVRDFAGMGLDLIDPWLA